jgi:non-lysosomal glucosylceramidase
MLQTFKLRCDELAKIKKLPPRDQGHYLPFNTYPHGCPLGGFGAGTIGRSPYGDFNIWHIKVGAHIAEELKANCFHVWQKQNEKITTHTLTARPYSSPRLNKFAKNYQAKDTVYMASFPKASYVFDDPHAPATIACEQYSPVLPDNYQESSYPVAVFEHTVTNKTNDSIEVSLMLSWANMTGWKFEDQRPGVQDNWFSFIKQNTDKRHTAIETTIGKQKAMGIVLGQTKKKSNQEMDGEIALVVLGDKNMEITRQDYFYTEGTGEDLYNQFAKDGTLDNLPPKQNLEHQSFGAALAAKVSLKPKETKKLTFVLVWDLPIVHFGTDVDRYKYYTNFFDRSGKNSWAIAKQALQKHTHWSAAIDEWHTSIVKDSKRIGQLHDMKSRLTYITMLINEMYFVTDGGAHWDAETGSFGLLECFDYPFYETIDVRFYGSFPLLKFWPKIELKVMEDFAATINLEDKTPTRFHFHAENAVLPLPKDKDERLLCADIRMKRGSCPHDLGSPKENPFLKPAGYTWQNTNYWKDLNTKFVLLCYRNYYFTKDIAFLKKVWPAMKQATDYLLAMDKDNDGIPENSGYPDQTYDNWIMDGVSSYCGILWLASLAALDAAARVLKQPADIQKYEKIITKATTTIQSLWTGSYYAFCTGNDDIMADQLAGQWYLDLLDLPLLPQDNIEKALKTIYRYNNGRWGIVSGKKRNHRMVDAEQGRDVWVGANFSLASLFFHHGLEKEANAVLNTMGKIIYEKGFFFRTPEGWDTKGQFTATMYMRPNAIWSLEF